MLSVTDTYSIRRMTFHWNWRSEQSWLKMFEVAIRSFSLNPTNFMQIERLEADSQ
jgi:hypothetical protein